jgi:hypothetical protein
VCRAGAAFLAAGAAAAACAGSDAADALGPVRVRIGAIDPAAFDAVREQPRSVAERIELLVDLFWKAGCRGEELSRVRPRQARYPDLVCRLPGRSSESIAVVASVTPRRPGARRDRIGATLLPHLYAALRVEEREHSLVFVAFAEKSGRGLRKDLLRLEETRRDVLRAVVDLERIRSGSSAILFSSPDPNLRQDLHAVRLALGEGPEPLRLFAAPGGNGSSRLGGVATTTLASIDAPDADGPDAGGPVADREAYRATARAIAVFLGYLDAALGRRARPPQVGAPAAASPGAAR